MTELLRSSGERIRRAAPPRFARMMHNSIHPLWIAEWGMWLGVGHRHYSAGTDDNGRLAPGAPFQYGYRYRHVLFTLKPRSQRIVRYSREFCLPALAADGAAAAPTGELCEGIQFIMSAFRRGSESDHRHRRVNMQQEGAALVSFSYGINDCESGLLTLSLRHISALLEFGL
jgi:hypothetical protein